MLCFGKIYYTGFSDGKNRVDLRKDMKLLHEILVDREKRTTSKGGPNVYLEEISARQPDTHRKHSGKRR